MGAGQTHLILDSCNSYFMVRPRKPGGRPLAAGLAADTAAIAGAPRVGAFLSTSSEQTVYEWSEIQSGIFSYLVRSGLMGGADADHDGRITYDELRGFVGVASRTVPNPAVRPHVFAQAPGGDGSQVLIDLNEGGARELRAGRRPALHPPQRRRLPPGRAAHRGGLFAQRSACGAGPSCASRWWWPRGGPASAPPA